MAMCSSWVHNWALSRLLGPVTSLEAPWTIGTLPGPLCSWARLMGLGLGLAGVSWRRLGKAGQGLWAWTGLYWLAQHSDTHRTLWHTPFQELCWLTPESAVLDILSFAHFLTYFGSFGSFGSFDNLWPHIGHQNITGPPWALLFDRDQRSHWNNHYNCCFIRVAALGIYRTVFLPQMLIWVRYPMQSVGHNIWQ